MDRIYTCIACSVMFEDPEVQRSHYKTDWHRYNLKRKVAELPPVTLDEFQIKVEAQKLQKEEKVKDHTTYCMPCNKTFSSASTYENHFKSKKHNEMLKKTEKQEESRGKEPMKRSTKAKIKPGILPPLQDNAIDDNSDEWEDVDENDEAEADEEILEKEADEETEALPQTFCLFCPHESVSVIDNIRHMTKSHSFFIPDLQYVTNLEALLVYLGAKVGDGKVCLFCNNHSKQYQTVRAVQKHMVDKGHCMIDYEGDAMLEYADFYDFSSSYPDNEHVADTDSEISYDNTLTVDPSTMELVLPSGARAGHRALRRYYSQNVPMENVLNKQRPMITSSDSQCKALGLNERTLSYAIRKKIVARKFENRQRAQWITALGVKANRLQKFYRHQVMYCG